MSNSFRSSAVPVSFRWHSARAWAVLALLSAAIAWAWAHEGHAPLPTRGAQVDVARGLVVLSREAREALDVQSAEVVSEAPPESILAYASLVPPWQKHAYASSRLPGRIVQLHVRAGQHVEAGQTLAEVQSPDLENLQLELLNARNDIRLAEQVVQGLKESSASVSGQSILDAENKLRQARNALDVARGKWTSLGLSRETLDGLLDEPGQRRVPAMPVRSLVAGTVIHADLNIGKVVEAGEHLFEIVDLSKVWARIGVLEHDLHRVEQGQTVELRLTAYPGEMFRGTVQVKGFGLDHQTQLHTVWAEFDNPSDREPRLLPGMSGWAHILLPARAKTLTVPAAALVNDGLDRYLLLEQAGTAGASEYRKQSVVVVRETPAWAQIRSADVFPGDRVVSRGAHELAGFFVPGVLWLSPETARTIGLRVEPVQADVVEEVVDLDGAVEVPPDRRVLASSPLPGNLLKLHIDRGQQVQTGQLVAEVASLELQNLQLSLLGEQLDLELLEQQLGALRQAGNSVPWRKILEAEGQRNAARNRRDALKRRLKTAGLSAAQVEEVVERRQVVEAVPVRAPRAGHVVSFDKVLGQAVRAEEPLVEIHDLSHPLVQGFVSERDLVRVRVGQEARVRFVADPSTTLTGKVVRSGRVFAAGDQTLSVWVELDHSSSRPLLHNQLARLSLTVSRPSPTLAVPLTAVVRDGTQAFVFAQKEDGTFDRRAVELGQADDRRVEVLAGLAAGERIAVSGTRELQTAYASLR